MTDKPTLLSLAERVEKLDGPCRETDAEIASALGLVPKKYVNYGGRGYFSDDLPGRRKAMWQPLAYTASLDAAMTLVPESHYLRSLGFEPEGEYQGWIVALGGHSDIGLELSRCQGDSHAHKVKTMPLAIVAAALRAMASDLAIETHEQRL